MIYTVRDILTKMKTLILALNSKYIHKSLAPWCLKAYCEERDENLKIEIIERTVNENINDILGALYEKSPDILGISCYIWNIEMVGRLVPMIKKVMPECKIILGGPEVSYGGEYMADEIISGEGEVAFFESVHRIVYGTEAEKVSHSFADFPSPFTEQYFASFIENGENTMPYKLVYYETTRGCPFSCAYCLSSAICGITEIPLTRVKKELTRITSYGARCIKFVDRTFNANRKRAKDILMFISEMQTDCTFHFEVAADLFDDEMFMIIEKLPIARVQFEIGIQSVSEEVLQCVNRKTNTDLVLRNIKRLCDMGNCHIHVDLIAGLPKETRESFIDGINKVIPIAPHALQLGFLKILKGSALYSVKDKAEYSHFPPYEILFSESMSFEHLREFKKIEKVIDKFLNTGMYKTSMDYAFTLFETPFDCLTAIADFWDSIGERALTLKDSYSLLYDFLLKYGDAKRAEFTIKEDCLTYDNKGRLPEKIEAKRDKEYQRMFKKESGLSQIRHEYFDYDDTDRIFIYDEKHPISGKYKCIIKKKDKASGESAMNNSPN